MTDVVATARAWLAEDPDPDTRAELSALLDAGDLPALEDRFAGLLRFGTAGLRGELGAGPNRMNRAVVIRAAAGLAAYLTSNAPPDAAPGSVVIGYDARHKSDVFARDTAAVLEAAGLHALLLPRPLPTPVLAYAIRHLGCVAGVMVTASHNPPRDNGYKVYLGDGSQIVPPADTGIAAAIDAIGPLAGVPRADSGWEVLGETPLDAYLDRARTVVRPDGPRDVRIVHTSMHGVGGGVMLSAFERAGFGDVTVVPEQAEPDPDFPTVAFPNPEEPGAMDLAFATAAATGADLVIANDPDADRCAVAVPDTTAPGGWRMLRGDEVGALLGVEAARRASGTHGTLATTIVSSSLLGAVAHRHGLAHAETLTGFKWLARVPDLVFAYEEALGYCVDPAGVRDKDGITAALLVAELTAAAKRDGRTLPDLLDDLATEYGLHATDQYAVRVTRLDRITAAMADLRAAPPTTLGGLTVTRADDLTTGTADLPPTDGLRYTLAGTDTITSARIIIRPSGTEPKLKSYLEVVVPVRTSLPEAHTVATTALATLKADLTAALATWLGSST
ncbi:phospho-sugar mutase [Yinghuangia sp. ASG 101]|uniref:phospho-sugar mutase n=1 Tax=Yinghuangia sp. ASG 101 TaxID=2896848 RepID=UPI001E64361A|nr:phospho-sugar mutase [Yinghuangia sp. ASG 101]UGQ14446.1 phospho-sugar mutase [Yinghuangia sp. ASG 101]